MPLQLFRRLDWPQISAGTVAVGFGNGRHRGKEGQRRGSERLEEEEEEKRSGLQGAHIYIALKQKCNQRAGAPIAIYGR